MAKRNMSENSLKNLEKGKDTQFKTGDEAAKECGRKGGLQLGINNQERRLLKEICEIIGEQIDEETGEIIKNEILKSLIKAYIRMGGIQMQISCTSVKFNT